MNLTLNVQTENDGWMGIKSDQTSVSDSGRPPAGALTDQGARWGSGSPFPTLFSPIQVGPMTVPNRLCETTNSIGAGRRDGLPDPDFIEHHAAKARGGIGWIGNEAWMLESPLPRHVRTEAVPAGLATPAAFHQRPDFVTRVRAFTDAVHDAGSVAVFQLAHVTAMFGPSSVPTSGGHDLIPHELDETEIACVIASYAAAAARLTEAGADGIEIHATHESLAHLFLSPATNHRRDRWGGSVEHRTRFVVAVLDAVRATVGSSVAVGVRLGLGEARPGGADDHEALEIAGTIASATELDFLSVDRGHSWGDPSYVPPSHHRVALGAAAARQLRAVVHSITEIPILYAGRVFDPQVAEELLVSKVCDLVGVTRASIADPEFGVKAREGRLSEIRWCIGCNRCIDNAEQGHGTGLAAKGSRAICSVNPTVGNERLWNRAMASTPPRRRVVVVGAGAAGLEAARVARLRGHDVTLLERSGHIGGQLRLASRAPGRDQFANFVEFLDEEMSRLGVTVELGREVDAEMVLSLQPDAVVCATGSRPRLPLHVPSGLDLVQAWDVLAGRANLGRRVAVISEEDGMVTPSVAEYLAATGHEVLVFHHWAGVACAVGRYTSGTVLRRLEDAGVQLADHLRLHSVVDRTLILASTLTGVRREVDGIDSVVVSCGSTPDVDLYRQLTGRVAGLSLVGDAWAPRGIHESTEQGMLAALAIA